jgi:hypothetical protein
MPPETPTPDDLASLWLEALFSADAECASSSVAEPRPGRAAAEEPSENGQRELAKK